MECVGYYYDVEKEWTDIFDGNVIGKNLYGQNMYRVDIQIPELNSSTTHYLFVEAIAVNDGGNRTNTTKTGWFEYKFQIDPQ